jgi:hypothetical protein
VGQEPVFIEAIDKIIVPLVRFLPAQKNIQADFFALPAGFFVAPQELFHPLFPGPIPANGGIPVEKVIGNDYAGKTPIPVFFNIVPAPRHTTGASLRRVEVGFI